MLAYKLQIAETILRVFTGVLFLFQGYDKIFKVKLSGVIDTFLSDAELHHIHKPLVTVISYYTSIVELVCGITLILGIFTDYSLILLGIDLVLVCIAFSLLEPMWDMRHVFPRLLLVATLLLLPEEWNKISLDFLLKQYLKLNI